MYASGRCEERMGHALNSAACPVPLDEIRVTTKSGRLIRDGEGYFHENRVPAPVTDPTKHLVDYSGAGAGASMEESLERLGIEGLHTLRVHDPNDTGVSAASPFPSSSEVSEQLRSTTRAARIRQTTSSSAWRPGRAWWRSAAPAGSRRSRSA